MSRRQELAAVALALAIVLLADVPRLLVGILYTVPGHVYVGEVWDAFDLPQYVEAIREGATGRWLYEGRLWGGTGAGAYLFQLPYLAFGHVAGGLRLDSLQALEVLRWTAQLVGLAGAVVFLRRAVAPELRGWALFLGGVAGGLGFLFLARPATPLGPVLPMDVATPSFNLVAAFLGAPHLALMAGCIAIFGWGFLAVAAGDRRGLAGLLALAIVLEVHPFEVVAVVVSAAATALVLRRTPLVAGYIAAATALCALQLVYVALTARADSVFAAMSSTSLTTEVGNLPSLLVSRAWVLALALAALVLARRAPDHTLVFLAGWAGLSALLNISGVDPAGPLHRSIEGSSLAFGALAARGLPASPRWRALLVAGCLVSPLIQAAGTLYVGAGDQDAWVSRDVRSVARQAAQAGLTGCAVGRLREVRWLAAESDLCESPEPDAAAADVAAAEPADRAATIDRHGARYDLVDGTGEVAGLQPVASSGDVRLVTAR